MAVVDISTFALPLSHTSAAGISAAGLATTNVAYIRTTHPNDPDVTTSSLFKVMLLSSAPHARFDHAKVSPDQ